MSRRGQQLLSLLLMILMAGLIYLLYPGRQPATPVTAPPPAEPRQPAPASTTRPGPIPPLDDFSEMVTRPLFSQERRPAATETVQSAASEPSRPGPPASKQFTVIGIIITGQEKVALLKPRRAKGEVLRVKEGETVTGWKVMEIGPEAVVVRQGGRSDRLKLSDNVLSAAEKRRLLQQARRAAGRQQRAIRRSNAQPRPAPKRQTQVKKPVR